MSRNTDNSASIIGDFYLGIQHKSPYSGFKNFKSAGHNGYFELGEYNAQGFFLPDHDIQYTFEFQGTSKKVNIGRFSHYLFSDKAAFLPLFRLE